MKIHGKVSDTAKRSSGGLVRKLEYKHAVDTIGLKNDHLSGVLFTLKTIFMNNSIPSWTYRYDIDENRDDYIKLINKVFDSGRLLFGEELENFQEEFAK